MDSDMSFGSALWDNIPAIETYTQEGIEFLQKLNDYVKKRALIDSEYAKSIQKLHEIFFEAPKKNIKKNKNDKETSLAKGWNALNDQSNQMIQTFQRISRKMDDDIFISIRDYTKTLENSRKQNLKNELKKTYDNLDRVKRSYEVASKLSEDSKIAFDKADKDLNVTKGQVDKLREEYKSKSKKAEDSDTEYQNILKKTNEAQSSHFSKDLPVAANSLQSLEEKRVGFVKEILISLAGLYRNGITEIEQGLNDFHKIAESIDPTENHCYFVKTTKSGNQKPADIQYEKYGKNTKKTKSNSKQSMEEDSLESIPPEKASKKAQQRIKEIDKELAEVEKKLGGKRTLLEAYKSQTSVQQGQYILELQSQIDELEQQSDISKSKKYNYEAFLAKTNSKPMPTPPVLYNQKSTLSRVLNSEGKLLESAQSNMSFNSKEEKESHDSLKEQEPKPDIKPTPEIDCKEFDDDTEKEIAVEIVNQKYKALYEYVGDAEAEELSLTIGEPVTIVEKESSGWWKARNKDGKEGFVPHNYLEIDNIQE